MSVFRIVSFKDCRRVVDRGITKFRSIPLRERSYKLSSSAKPTVAVSTTIRIEDIDINPMVWNPSKVIMYHPDYIK